MFAKFTTSKALLFGGASAIVFLWSGAAAAQEANSTLSSPGARAQQGIEEIVVTAQRREESVQDVPMAVSAFTSEMLESQRLDGGSELLRAIPNANFSKGYFSGFNFQIRGVGTQLGTAAGDSGVGIHLNNVPMTTSRFFEAEFYDTERVEVLRGPQGTLYGRNATGGVVNVVTNRPTSEFGGALTAEVASYDTVRTQAMLNLPLGERVGLRVAGSYLSRSGFGENTYTGDSIDGRDLWSARATLHADITDEFQATVIYQHFDEDDDRSRTGVQICVRDPGPASVGGVAVADPIVRGYMSQGCADASIYSANANQAPNSLGTIFGNITQNFGLTNGDYFAGTTVSRDLHDVQSFSHPHYSASNDLVQLHLQLQATPTLRFSSITSYMDDDLSSTRDFQGAIPSAAFLNTFFTPGGVFNDPQLGAHDRLITEDILLQTSTQFSQELRLDTQFDGSFNFSLGAIYVNFDTTLQQYIQGNVFTLAANIFNGGVPCALGNPACIYIEPNDTPTGLGHNYFLSASPYELNSSAIFGEAYFDLSDTLRLTVGARYTRDQKSQVVLPVRLLTAGSGQAPGAIPEISIEFNEPTGRVALDWRPDFSFTDQTLIYGVISHGYKAGGTNPPASFVLAPPYRPEFIDAIEIGTKNTLLDGRMLLNLSAFHYDYQDYQVTEIRNRTQEIQNIDATVRGLEIELAYEPVEDLVFNLTAGVLDTNITSGSFVDPTNFTNRDPNLTLVRGFFASTCAVNTTALATYLATNPTGAAFGNSVCAGLVPGLTPNLTGVPTNLSGNELPNAPNWTLSVGAQYSLNFDGGWRATLRGDYYRQAQSFARTYNTVGDRLDAYDNVNVTFTIESPGSGWQAQLFAKNLFDTQPVTNTFVLDQVIGVSRMGFTSDPRLVGLSLTRHF